jgi:hypothetical protein
MRQHIIEIHRNTGRATVISRLVAFFLSLVCHPARDTTIGAVGLAWHLSGAFSLGGTCGAYMSSEADVNS